MSRANALPVHPTLSQGQDFVPLPPVSPDASPAASDDESIAPMSPQSVAKPPEPVKRKRGRPPKQKNSLDKPSITHTKRSRGDPSGPRIINLNIDSSNILAKGTSRSSRVSQSATPPTSAPKTKTKTTGRPGRGRPRKNPAPPAKVGKPRGRPRRVPLVETSTAVAPAPEPRKSTGGISPNTKEPSAIGAPATEAPPSVPSFAPPYPYPSYELPPPLPSVTFPDVNGQTAPHVNGSVPGSHRGTLVPFSAPYGPPVLIPPPISGPTPSGSLLMSKQSHEGDTAQALYSILQVFPDTFSGETPAKGLIEDDLANFLARVRVTSENHSIQLSASALDRLRVLIIKNRLRGSALRWFCQAFSSDPPYDHLEQALEGVFGNNRHKYAQSVTSLRQTGSLQEYIVDFDILRGKETMLDRTLAQAFIYGLQEPKRGVVMDRLRSYPHPTLPITEVYKWARYD
ncbi:hypothetical protein DICA0_E25730 [Diutina catenulata]